MPSFLDSVVGWLREGYPQGVPEQDYVPLFALLRRRLTDDEVATVVEHLVASRLDPGQLDRHRGLDHQDHRRACRTRTDVERVRQHLPDGL